MSDDGNKIAVGAWNGGYVKVYDYVAMTRNHDTFFDWNMSATLSSSQSGAQFGVSLSMAGAGDTLAVGAPLIGALHRGSVFVYYNRFDQSNITNGTEFGNTTVLKSSQFSESSTFYGDSRRGALVCSFVAHSFLRSFLVLVSHFSFILRCLFKTISAGALR